MGQLQFCLSSYRLYRSPIPQSAKLTAPFAQRSLPCSPDGARIGSVSLSKNDFIMASDFSYKSFLEELDSCLKKEN
ncbi:MAG: hypothetical protein J6A90_07270 [Clostridia bacterium]|nr:hypothetical protein [Clostridia bacterium]